MGVFEIDERDEPRSRVVTLTNLKGNPQIAFERYDLDTRPLGREIPMRVFKLFAGNDLEQAYVNPSAGVGFLMNYGVIEVGREPISSQDLITVRRALGREVATPTPAPTPTPTPSPTATPAPSADCSASSSELVFDSPDRSNTCRVSWVGAKIGETVKSTAFSTKGGSNGSLEGTCVGRENWNFSYYCPNKTGLTCAGGGAATIPSSSGGKACTFNWPHTVTGQTYSGKSDAILGSANGTIRADCVDEGGASGVWKNVQAVCP